jgi:hypothetical protein
LNGRTRIASSLAAAALIAAPAGALAATPEEIYADCNSSSSGFLQHAYSMSDLINARRHLQGDNAEYSNCPDAIAKRIQRLRGERQAGGPDESDAAATPAGGTSGPGPRDGLQGPAASAPDRAPASGGSPSSGAGSGSTGGPPAPSTPTPSSAAMPTTTAAPLPLPTADAADAGFGDNARPLPPALTAALAVIGIGAIVVAVLAVRQRILPRKPD